MAFRAPIRTMATVARQSLKIGLIPADGIGKEVIPVRVFNADPKTNSFYNVTWVLCCNIDCKSCNWGPRIRYTQTGVHWLVGWFRTFYEKGHCFAWWDCQVRSKQLDFVFSLLYFRGSILKNECDCALFGSVRCDLLFGKQSYNSNSFRLLCAVLRLVK